MGIGSSGWLRNLERLENSDGKTLPCVRTYENDSARLSLIGTVAFDLALTAAAADNDHLRENVPVMVVETVFPGGSDPKATFLPTKKVKERVKSLHGIKIIQAAVGAGRTILISDSGNVYSCGKDSFGEAEYRGQGSNVPGVDLVLFSHCFKCSC
ncbi:hypothetical protein Bca4012_003428 [Brassica carinata]|uniref:Uncharacterized protein n=1 Tax=Brassica carinata TaxID=52824 RepID=A0A8X7S0B4_BRACI|nr:hypothetical protein Bca52824_044289 [Brassica carinata]